MYNACMILLYIHKIYYCTYRISIHAYKYVGINMYIMYEYAHIWAWVIPTCM